jgi:pyruvate carboxylase
MVGDLAIFMVQNDLNKDNLVEEGQRLNFPDSVVSYFKGMMGQPKGGFPKDIQAVVLKGEEPITCRPGELLAPMDFAKVGQDLASKYNWQANNQDIISWCLYPKVMEDYIKYSQDFTDISRMDSAVFFMGMLPGETTELTIEDGKTLMIKYIGPAELNDDGTRNMLFELNGIRREVAVPDKSAEGQQSKNVLANLEDPKQIGSSLPGAVSKVLVKEGQEVKMNQTLAVIEAMKMEVSIVSPQDGIIKEIRVTEKQSIRAGELLMTLV